jgi:hypothetical protein
MSLHELYRIRTDAEISNDVVDIIGYAPFHHHLLIKNFFLSDLSGTGKRLPTKFIFLNILGYHVSFFCAPSTMFNVETLRTETNNSFSKSCLFTFEELSYMKAK